MNYQNLTRTLVDSFNALADEVQGLTDRKIILEHKLRFAHEQFQYLADKHTPAAAEILDTLAKLQIPPESHHASLAEAASVPLPPRAPRHPISQHRIALLIRDGRRAAQHLSSSTLSKTSLSSRDVFSSHSRQTSMSTALEQDFTVEGKMGNLDCPFSRKAADEAVAGDGGNDGNGSSGGSDVNDDSRQDDERPSASGAATTDKAEGSASCRLQDPICAAIPEEATMRPASSVGASAAKCPIRYLDQRSPEEIARYVETHKHELPRSHEVCVGRYQRNAEEIRKLDAKYGNLASMIQELSQLHKPMLPSASTRGPERVSAVNSQLDRASVERVEYWAQEVSEMGMDRDSSLNPIGVGIGVAADEQGADDPDDQDADDTDDQERNGRFSRLLKEVRVGESPSRPWGISVPVCEPYGQDKNGQPLSPPPAPVVSFDTAPALGPPRKCPFDQSKPAEALRSSTAPATSNSNDDNNKHTGQFSFMAVDGAPAPPIDGRRFARSQVESTTSGPPRRPEFPSAAAAPGGAAAAGDSGSGGGKKKDYEKLGTGPQMVFTGPLFIGYSMDQAIQFMSHWQGGRS